MIEGTETCRVTGPALASGFFRRAQSFAR